MQESKIIHLYYPLEQMCSCRQVITVLDLIMLKSYTIDQKDQGYKLVIVRPPETFVERELLKRFISPSR